MSTLKYLFALVLLMFLPTQTFAQMQPFINNGVTWSEDEFQKLDKSRPSTPLPDGCPDITRIFADLHRNYGLYYSSNDSIFTPTFRDDWAEMLRRRAMLQSSMFTRNQDEIQTVLNYFKNTKDIPDVAYDVLFWSLHRMYRDQNTDYFLLEEFINVMNPHYIEKGDDLDRIVLCYIMDGYCDFEMTHLNHEAEHFQNAIHNYRQAIALTTDLSRFKSTIAPFYLLAAYCNLMVSFTPDQFVTMQEAYNLRRQLVELYRKNKKIFHDIPKLYEYYQWILNLFDLKAPYICIDNNEAQGKLFRELYRNYLAVIGNGPSNNFSNLGHLYHSELMIDYLYIQVSLGKMDPDLALDKCRSLVRYEILNGEEIDYTQPDRHITYLYNTFVTCLRILELSNLSDADKHDYLVRYLNIIYNVISKYPRAVDVNERVDAERHIITHNSLQKYLSTDERIEILHSLIIIEQPQTYAHVSMVASLCDVLLNAVINYRPDLLRDVPGCATRIDVWQNADSLKAFFHQAAVYHDLGKNLIPNIVNNSFRKINDNEFKYIKLHPEMAKVFLDLDPSLSIYTDICLGHHKWYNGKGGYPVWFDNTKSNQRILIDILTICDCTDAATDFFGRNYHRNKTFRQVLGEFDRDKGVKYNPDLVELIQSTPALIEEMSNIVEVNRMEAYYNIYKRYFR